MHVDKLPLLYPIKDTFDNCTNIHKSFKTINYCNN